MHGIDTCDQASSVCARTELMENQITTVPVALLKLMPDRECSVVNFPGRLFGLLPLCR